MPTSAFFAWPVLFMLMAAPCLADSPTVDVPGPIKIIMLPARAHVFQLGITQFEEVPLWNAVARSNLAESMTEALDPSLHATLVAMPPVTDEENARIDEFVGVANLAATSLNDPLGIGFGSARRLAADLTLGNSLTFLRDRTGADYVIGAFAYQVEQSKTAAAMMSASTVAALAGLPTPMLVAVTGSHVMAFIADLRTGKIVWCNSTSGFEVSGLNFRDLRDPESVTSAVRKLFKTFPAKFSDGQQIQDGTNEPAQLTRPVQGRFSIQAPAGWMPLKEVTHVSATRDGRFLGQWFVQMVDHRDSTQLVARQTNPKTKPDSLATYYLEHLQQLGLADLKVDVQQTAAPIAGIPSFRLHYSYNLPVHLGGARISAVATGMVTSRGVLIARLLAPQLNYYDKILPDFEAALQSVKLIPTRHTY